MEGFNGYKNHCVLSLTPNFLFKLGKEIDLK